MPNANDPWYFMDLTFGRVRLVLDDGPYSYGRDFW